MSRLLLDSTVLIDALRGRSAAQRVAGLRRRGVEPWVCAISVEEVWRGILPGDEEPVRRLFHALRLAPLGVAEGMRAGAWRRQFARQGVTLHQADGLIASAAVGAVALATANVGDFPMGTWSWSTGPRAPETGGGLSDRPVLGARHSTCLLTGPGG